MSNQPRTPQPSGSGDNAPAERRLALRIMTRPLDTNHYGTIFGGVILSAIDQAGFVEARRSGSHRWVTASIERVDFHAPVFVGDVVNLYTATIKQGTKSVTIRVDVESERSPSQSPVPVTSATLTMVAVDSRGTPIPFRSPATV